MVLESFISINKHHRNLLAVEFLQLRVRLNIDYRQSKRDAAADTFDDRFRFIAQMAARAGLDFDPDRVVRHFVEAAHYRACAPRGPHAPSMYERAFAPAGRLSQFAVLERQVMGISSRPAGGVRIPNGRALRQQVRCR